MPMVEINLTLLNRLIDVLIEHGGDNGGPYYCCKEKVAKIMSSIAINSGISYVFNGDCPQFILKKDNPHLFGEERE